MGYTNEIILLGSLLALLSIVASAVSSRLGAPLLLVFVVLGMLAGEDGPGGIVFNDFHTAQLVGSIALAIIIFDGGLRTRKEVFGVALWPSVSLATVGVLITAVVVAVFATWLLDLHWLQGLLLGSIVGSTDAAAVFGSLRTAGAELKQRVSATLEIESASNDPMAIFLTIALVGVLAAGGTSLTSGVLVELVRQFGIGAAVGWFGGRWLGALINRLSLVTGLYPLLAAAGGVFIFGAAAVMNGSGFLAIYIAGIVLGNMPLQASQNILRVHDGLSWLSQITMFLMLGLLVTPRELIEYSYGGAIIAAALIFVARPIAVLLSLLPFGFPWREHVFISWVGLRGAVPMLLAIFPLAAGIPDGALYFNVAFFVILASLVIQGWTLAPAARLLSQEIPPTTEPVQRFNLDIPGHFDREIACYRVLPGSVVANRPVGELSISRDSHITTVVRDDAVMNVNEGLKLLPDDLVYIFTDPAHVPELNRLFDPHQAPARLEEHRFYGDFLLDGSANAGDLADAYGLPIEETRRNETLDGYLRTAFRGRPVVGDRVRLGRTELVVRQMDGGRITRVGLKLHD
jgi:cell volume regulation protein A